jgi:hypothetical protein
MDPLWNFGHAHANNDVQIVTDEREQKTANQQYVPKSANTLLIGSSRSTYIHTTGFKNWDVYNYSVANLSMREYQSMMLYAFKKNSDYERVILGVVCQISTRAVGSHAQFRIMKQKYKNHFIEQKTYCRMTSLNIQWITSNYLQMMKL